MLYTKKKKIVMNDLIFHCDNYKVFYSLKEIVAASQNIIQRNDI